jgi:hypothetical protein
MLRWRKFAGDSPESIAELMSSGNRRDAKLRFTGKEILAALERYRAGARAVGFEKKTAPALETLCGCTE